MMASTHRTRRQKTLAVAFGVGGARALAQIAVIEALDEMQLKPVAVAGTSVGALIAGAYAAGMAGREMRRHVIAVAHNRTLAFAHLLASRATSLSAWLAAPFGNPMLIDATKFCAAFLPTVIPDDFSALKIPLTVVATDLHRRCEVRLSSGPLKLALACSMALPGLVQPVEIDGRILVDGGAVNPLPFDLLRDRADVVLAIDCSGGPSESGGIPDPWETLFTTLQIMGHSIVAEKLRHGGPDLVIRPNVGYFRLFDFFAASAILRAADPVKAQIKERLAELLGA